MVKRETQKRRALIIEQLRDQGTVKVDELAVRFAVSEVSIRKDLSELEKSNFCIRRLGGAIYSDRTQNSTSKLDPVKQALAYSAAQLIANDTRIILDSGRTTSYLLPQLTHLNGLKVMTNSLPIAHKLTLLPNEPTVLMPGGTWDAKTESFQGQLAEQMLRFYDFDQLFIGADGLDPERGTTTFNELMSLSRVMAEVSAQVIVMAESCKLGRKMPNVELAWSQVDILITDSNLPKQQQQQIEDLGIHVLIASMENKQCVE